MTRTDKAWSFTPLLVLCFYQRFTHKDFAVQMAIVSSYLTNGPTKKIAVTLTEHIPKQPKSTRNILDAVHLLITDFKLTNDGVEIKGLGHTQRHASLADMEVVIFQIL